ncbi:MAG TPA: DUF2785 domain-containing protein [Steroidobacteraceae bacterium]|nr:DUF2785 domain-containing protein [Steroidobacteraceae bacterium]
MRELFIKPFLATVLLGFSGQALSAAGCPPPEFDRPALEALKTSKFELADDARRAKLALALLPCLADPDPALRDGVAFEAYFTWMRAKRLDAATRTELLGALSAMLEPDPADRDGVRQPFAALVLSEVARTDRVEAWLNPGQRAALVDVAARYLTSVRDYRGFDQKAGWRHGVAHGADLVLQVALNPAVDRAALDRLLAAVASQVAPAGEHAYIDGEPERLARAVLFAAQRGLYSPDDWSVWLLKAAAPAPLDSWDAAYTSRVGLAKRHNVHAFLFALYVNARESADANMQALVPGLQAALKTLR